MVEQMGTQRHATALNALVGYLHKARKARKARTVRNAHNARNALLGYLHEAFRVAFVCNDVTAEGLNGAQGTNRVNIN